MSIRPAPESAHRPIARMRARFALGVAEGDELAEVSTPWGCFADAARPWVYGARGRWAVLERVGVRAARSSDLGPFRLAYLEALLRIADWRASG